MTFNIRLDLGHKKELEAFARFCNDLAGLSDEIIADTDARQFRLYGPQTQLAALTASEANAYEPQPVDPDALTEVGKKIAETQANAPKATRERGKPSPGHARRTKAEIAEDDAFLAGVNTEVNNLGLTDTDAPVETIVEDDAATQAADAADEAAETAADKPADAPPSLEDIRNVLGLYQKIYGLPAAMTDGPLVLQEVCGEGVVKVSAVPEDKIAAVVAALKKAGNENRFGRTAVTS